MGIKMHMPTWPLGTRLTIQDQARPASLLVSLFFTLLLSSLFYLLHPSLFPPYLHFIVINAHCRHWRYFKCFSSTLVSAGCWAMSPPWAFSPETGLLQLTSSFGVHFYSPSALTVFKMRQRFKGNNQSTIKTVFRDAFVLSTPHRWLNDIWLFSYFPIINYKLCWLIVAFLCNSLSLNII